LNAGGIEAYYDDFVKTAEIDLLKSEDLGNTMKELITKKPIFFKINDANKAVDYSKMTPKEIEAQKRRKVIETSKGFYF
jgi:hypothetical protein